MNDIGAYDASKTHRSCSACKFLSKKCTAGCPLAAYFPDENTREFQAVLRVFGVSNLRKMILGVGEADRRLLVESIVMEAFMREKDPVLGMYSEYTRALNELIHYKTLAQTNSVRILQTQLQVIRMRGDNNGNCHDSMSVPSDHIEWYNGNCPVANLGEAGEVAVTGNKTYNNTPMASSRGEQ